MHADIARLLVMCVYGYYYCYVFNLNNHVAVPICDTKVKLHAYISRLLRVNYIKQRRRPKQWAERGDRGAAFALVRYNINNTVNSEAL